MTCGGLLQPACDNAQVVAGLAQISNQLHGLSAYLFIFTVFVVIMMAVMLVLMVKGVR